MLTWILHTIFSPTGNLSLSKRYQDAGEFASTWQIKSGVDYSKAVIYANEVWNDKRAAFDLMGGNADNIVRLMTGGTGILAIAMMLNVKWETVGVAICAIPSFLLAIASVICAIRARFPVDVPTHHSVKWRIEWEEKYPGADIDATLLARVWQRIEGYDDLLEIRSDLVEWASKLAALSVASLSFPLAIAIIGACWHHAKGQ